MLHGESIEGDKPQRLPNARAMKDLETNTDGQVERPLRQLKSERTERAKALARKLGWFSVGLGVAQVAMPGLLSKLLFGHDVPAKRRILRGLGVREIAVGLGLIGRPSGVNNWMFARVAGDITNLALLGWSAGAQKTNLANVAFSAAAVAGVTAFDWQAGRTVRRATATARGRYDVSKSVIVSCTPEAAYRQWRDFRSIPKFMTLITSVEAMEDNRSRWSVSGPGGIDLSWDAQITEDLPNERIAWQTLSGAPLPSAGDVRFLSLSKARGTEVRLRMAYDESSRTTLRSLRKIFAKGLDFQLGQDLRRFKQLLEVGEVVQSDASLHTGPHPARPASRGGAR